MIWIGLAIGVMAVANWQGGDAWQSGFCADAAVAIIRAFIRDRF